MSKNKMTIGDYGELLTIGAGGIGGLAALLVGGLSMAGFLMKRADSNYQQRKLTQQREEMQAEMAYMIRQETKRQRQIEKQYYDNRRNNHY